MPAYVSPALLRTYARDGHTSNEQTSRAIDAAVWFYYTNTYYCHNCHTHILPDICTMYFWHTHPATQAPQHTHFTPTCHINLNHQYLSVYLSLQDLVWYCTLCLCTHGAGLNNGRTALWFKHADKSSTTPLPTPPCRGTVQLPSAGVQALPATHHPLLVTWTYAFHYTVGWLWHTATHHLCPATVAQLRRALN